MNDPQHIFGDIIDTYTDKQAIEDGTLVNLEKLFDRTVTFHGRPVNRMTGHLLAAMLPFLIDSNNPLDPAPESIEDMTRGHVRDLRRTLRSKLKYARDTAGTGEERDYLYELPPRLWLVRNEVPGWTLMLPEDY